jgi:hypothetical protein
MAERYLLHIHSTKLAADDWRSTDASFTKTGGSCGASNNISERELSNCSGRMAVIRPIKTFHAYTEQSLLHIVPVELAANE